MKVTRECPVVTGSEKDEGLTRLRQRGQKVLCQIILKGTQSFEKASRLAFSEIVAYALFSFVLPCLFLPYAQFR
ncbi:MAG TPA: hypothetical protein PK986_01230 [Spirochaetota bacterium]|jgi:predicted HTH domain antitoxin|nr:hypothetical protein [Spirochaetota bacterium]HQO39066.1 hypothetical protein [Spirochaetota bacterium]